MFNGSPRNDTMVSSFQGHVQWIWAESFTENLQKRRYSDIAVPKLSELSNFCSVINTQSRWLPNARQVGHHGELKHIFLSNYSPLYPKANFILISLLFFYKKNLWWRFRGLLIHSLVTPNCKNMEKSSLNFGDQPLNIEIEQNFYLSGQNRYLINSLNKASSVSNCCELKRDIFFSFS